MERRANEVETAYNLGRACHQLGLAYLAAEWYNRALDAPSSGHSVKREAAHNLSLIYRASGNDALARSVLRAHCTF